MTEDRQEHFSGAIRIVMGAVVGSVMGVIAVSAVILWLLYG